MEHRRRRSRVEIEHGSEYDIYHVTTRHETTLRFLREHNLLKNDVSCDICESQMNIIVNNSKADLEQLRCPVRNCFTTKSIRVQSFFSGSKLSLMELTRLLFYYFLQDFSLEEILTKTKISKSTSSQIYCKVREMISDYIQATYLHSPFQDPNDEELVVEVDESLFTHSDGNQIWVFGIYCRNTREARCFTVADRTAQTLIPIIQTHVPEGSHIYTDGWLAYNSLSDLGYNHTRVIHERGFGSGDNTTNHIEALWSDLKNLTNHDSGIKAGTLRPLELVQHHIDTGLWRRMNRGRDLVEELITVINYSY